MQGRTGTYRIQKSPGESFRAYIPPELLIDSPVDLASLCPLLEKATFALAELNSLTKVIPNTALFLYMYVRKEALLSSQIEGTQSSFSDLILFEHDQKPDVSLEDVEEVSNYVKAMQHGLKRIEGGFPLSLRLIKEIHAVLLSGGRGAHQQPGAFRRTQNWVGGTRPGNAVFVPPPVDALMDCLYNLETFIQEAPIPVLIKAGIAHLQFESIHPFLDGNGRLGRLLITLLLCESGMLDAPILYLSLYLKHNRATYYSLLQEVRDRGTWQTWLEFFLEGVVASSNQATQTAQAINTLFQDNEQQLEQLGRARISCKRVHDYLKTLPQVSVNVVAQALDIATPTARSALNHLVERGIVAEISGKQRDKIYVYQKYLHLLEAGTEPLSRPFTHS